MIKLNQSRPIPVLRQVFLYCLMLCCLPALAEPLSPFVLRYARLYERELAEERHGLAQEYRSLYLDARGSEKEIAGKSLYRAGVCERRAGRLESARAAWRELLETFPLSDPFGLAVRDVLKAVDWELERAEISGSISVPGDVSAPLDGPCFVFAGEWGNEPPVLTGRDGRFSMGRRVAGQLPDGRNYGLIYVSHASLPLVGADVWVGTGTTGLAVRLSAPISLAGRVVDKKGGPIGGTRVRVTACKGGNPSPPLWERVGMSGSSNASSILSAIPLPLDRLIPPVWSCTNGAFQISGLPADLRYVITADNAEYRVEMAPAAPAVQPGLGAVGGEGDAIGLSNLFASLTWLRGDLETGAPLRWGNLAGSIVVFHFGSAYQEASLRVQYPGEPGTLTRLLELYGAQQVAGIWVLPAGESRGESAQLALDLYPDLMVGVADGELSGTWAEGLRGRNVVLGRDGSILATCSDQQVYEVVKRAAVDKSCFLFAQ